MIAAKLLEQLEGVRKRGPGTWIARCPAHDDRSPSLSIRETDDGRVLIHCFAGCEARDVLAAIGLKFADLYPESLRNPARFDRSFAPVRRKMPADVALSCLANEALVVLLSAQDVKRGILPDSERLALAVDRILDAWGCSDE